jgi:hypothetical protein
MASSFEPLTGEQLVEMSQIVKHDLAGLGAAPWDRPGYQDGVPGLAADRKSYA